MRFGFVIPIYTVNEQRRNWAVASLRSLAKTVVIGEPPVICFVLNSAKENESEGIIRSSGLSQFDVMLIEQPPDAASIDACNIFGWSHILKTRPDITHLAMMTVDWLYNPRWLIELENIIQRHPQARAWWVYRSAFEFFHKTLRIEEDVLVRSFNAGGCFPAADYRAWNPDYHNFRISAPRVTDARFDENTGNLWMQMADGQNYTFTKGSRPTLPFTNGLTLDLIDPWMRQGERWVTKRSYILNIGVEGINQRLGAPEYAVDFVGFGDSEPAPVLSPTQSLFAPTASSLPAPLPATEPFTATIDLPEWSGYQLIVTLRRNVK